jgi:hypothetical protein
MNNIQKRGFYNLNKISFPCFAFGRTEKEVFQIGVFAPIF